jgi:hypothetical protein
VIGWRRLPIPLPPAQNETLASGLHRLATVHGLPDGELRQHLRVGTRVGDVDELREDLGRRLAAVTGHPVEALARALPELRVPAPHWPALRHLAQRACPRCTARHEGGPVRRLFAHRQYLLRTTAADRRTGDSGVDLLPGESACPRFVALGVLLERPDHLVEVRDRRAVVVFGRHKRLFARFTDDEHAEVTAAADRYGLTPTGFCSQATLDAARNLPTGTTAERMEHEALGNLQAGLFQARVTLNQLRAELEHTRNDTRATIDDLDKTITGAADALADLDNAISRIHRRLGRRCSVDDLRTRGS